MGLKSTLFVSSAFVIPLFSLLGIGKAEAARPHHATAAKAATSAGSTQPKAPARKTAVKSIKSENAEEIRVTAAHLRISSGGGMIQRRDDTRSVQSVSADYIAKQNATSNVVGLLAMMPSVNSMSQDPTGILSNGIMVRGLTVDDMGWVLDGAPTLSPGAGRFQAEMLDSENMDRVSITPGSSSTDDPVTSATGGVIYTKMKDPTSKARAQVDFTYGTFNTYRGFVRLDSGEIGHSGVKAFVSYSNASTDFWRGPGIAKKQHVDFKLLKSFNNGSTIALESVFNNNKNGYYYYPTQEEWRQYRWVNPSATYGGIHDGSYYKLNQTSLFYSGTVLAPAHVVLTPHLTWDTTPYFWYGFGWGPGGTTMTQGQTYLGNQRVDINLAQGTGGVAQNGQQYLASTGFGGPTYIGGINSKLAWTHGHNTLTVGYWYENYNLREKDPVGFINQETGDPADLSHAYNYYRLPNGKPYYYDNYSLRYQINAPYVMDTLRLLKDRLVINAGFKDVMVTRGVDNYVPGATPHMGISENIPLPSLGARYNFDRANQIYINAEGDYRQPFMGSTAQQYSVTTGAMTTGANSPKSQYAIKEEIGYRYNGEKIIASISFFNMNMTNRLLTLNTYQEGVQVQREFNAGGQTSRGVDIQVGTAPLWKRFTPYVTFAYLDARQDNNLQTVNSAGQTDYLRTAGKTQIASPHYQAGLGLSYDDGTFFGSVNIKYIGSQYSTLMNDEKMPGYVTNSVILGYRLPKFVMFNRPSIQVNLNNISNSTQRTGVYSYSDNARTTRGVFGGTISGSSPTYYVEPGFSALMTVRVPIE